MNSRRRGFRHWSRYTYRRRYRSGLHRFGLIRQNSNFRRRAKRNHIAVFQLTFNVNLPTVDVRAIRAAQIAKPEIFAALLDHRVIARDTGVIHTNCIVGGTSDGSRRADEQIACALPLTGND